MNKSHGHHTQLGQPLKGSTDRGGHWPYYQAKRHTPSRYQEQQDTRVSDFHHRKRAEWTHYTAKEGGPVLKPDVP